VKTNTPRAAGTHYAGTVAKSTIAPGTTVIQQPPPDDQGLTLIEYRSRSQLHYYVSLGHKRK
jgi:hypothetical protein